MFIIYSGCLRPKLAATRSLEMCSFFEFTKRYFSDASAVLMLVFVNFLVQLDLVGSRSVRIRDRFRWFPSLLEKRHHHWPASGRRFAGDSPTRRLPVRALVSRPSVLPLVIAVTLPDLSAFSTLKTVRVGADFFRGWVISFLQEKRFPWVMNGWLALVLLNSHPTQTS